MMKNKTLLMIALKSKKKKRKIFERKIKTIKI